jgi:small subunit ribosomal protein S15
LETGKKAEVVKAYQRHDGDTGSTEVQVAVSTHRISEITDHLREHRQDHHSRRGLFKLVGHRRRMLSYLHQEDVERYRTLIQRLGLRR